MRAAVPKFNCYCNELTLFFRYSLCPSHSIQYHNGPLFYRVRYSNIRRVLPLIDSSNYRKPISLISHSDVRYRGILAGIDPAASTIQLSNGMEHHFMHS